MRGDRRSSSLISTQTPLPDKIETTQLKGNGRLFFGPYRFPTHGIRRLLMAPAFPMGSLIAATRAREGR